MFAGGYKCQHLVQIMILVVISAAVVRRRPNGWLGVVGALGI